jgi:hypothetical protein
MMTISRKGTLDRFREIGGARVTRMWERGTWADEWEEKPVPQRMAGWRTVERVSTTYVVFDTGSHLHPYTADGITTHGNTLTVAYPFIRIEYDFSEGIL